MLFNLLFFSCQEKAPISEAIDSGAEISAPSFQFSIAVLADPHIAGGGEHSERLMQTVQWINEQKESRNIAMVVVLGDVGWDEGLVESKELLDELEMPYVPVIGDNEVYYGDEANFGTVYGPQYELLSTTFDDWNKDGEAVWNPEEEEDSWFYNFAFSHKGLRLITADWSARTDAPYFSEMGDLHDFAGGTWTFFESEIQSLQGRKENSVIMLSHIPMFMSPGSFDVAESERIAGLTNAYSDFIYADFAGHFHVNVDSELEDGGFEVFVTDAIWDDEITIRMLEVWENELEFSYVHEMIEFQYQ